MIKTHNVRSQMKYCTIKNKCSQKFYCRDILKFSSIPAGSSIQVGALNFLIPFLIYPFAFGNYFVR